MAQIPGHQRVRHPKTRRDHLHLHPVPFGNPGCGGRLVELDVLAASGIGDQARLKLFDLIACAVLDDRRHRVLGFVIAKDDADKAGFGFLADQFSLLPIAQIAQRQHGRR